MGIVDTVKEILGIKKVRPYEFEETLVLKTEDRVEVTAKEKIEAAKEKTKPVTVKAKAEEPKVKRETRKSLGNLTKVQIDDLAKERFGVDLDRRKTKTDMIEDFMSAQKKAK